MVAGLEVPHAHVHLIPFDAIPELSFAFAKAADPADLAALAARIRELLD
jgi:histidine triad (HIT) family protein